MSGGAPMVSHDSGDRDHAAAHLRLYVARDTPNSARAERNLMAALQNLGSGGVILEIVDVFTHPKRAITDGVIVTPMLIGLRAKGRLTMIGDLTDTAKLLALLQSLVDSARG